jgi:alkane 1-monooxygenase
MASRITKHVDLARYALIFLPLLVFLVGYLGKVVWLTIPLFFVVLPLARRWVGEVSTDRTEFNYSEMQLRVLVWIPRVFVFAWLATFGFLLWRMSVDTISPVYWLVMGVSLWIVTSVNTVIGHELVHQKYATDVVLGRLLLASSGHFFMAQEHKDHHGILGLTKHSDCAERDESIYRYLSRRVPSSFRSAWRWETERLERKQLGLWHHAVLRWALLPLGILMIVMATGNVWLVAMLLGVMVCTILTVQIITYLQHWGLKEGDSVWEDTCRLQASILLNHAFHQAHHERPSLSYFYLLPKEVSPKLPSGYAVMFLLCLFPNKFKAVMSKQLAHYQANGLLGVDSKQNLDCFKLAQ